MSFPNGHKSALHLIYFKMSKTETVGRNSGSQGNTVLYNAIGILGFQPYQTHIDLAAPPRTLDTNVVEPTPQGATSIRWSWSHQEPQEEHYFGEVGARTVTLPRRFFKNFIN
jgi:hypothetical protein